MHAAITLNRHAVRSDGKTAIQRARGTRALRDTAEFGERVLYRPLGAARGHRKLDPRWQYGVFMGIANRSNEVIAIVKAWAIRRLPEDERWKAEDVLKIQGIPTKPNPNGPGAELSTHISPEPVVRERVEDPTRHEVVLPFAVRLQDVQTHGFTAGCKGCTAARAGARAQTHSEECRRRIMQVLHHRGRAAPDHQEGAVPGAHEGQDAVGPGSHPRGWRRATRTWESGPSRRQDRLQHRCLQKPSQDENPRSTAPEHRLHPEPDPAESMCNPAHAPLSPGVGAGPEPVQPSTHAPLAPGARPGHGSVQHCARGPQSRSGAVGFASAGGGGEPQNEQGPKRRRVEGLSTPPTSGRTSPASAPGEAPRGRHPRGDDPRDDSASNSDMVMSMGWASRSKQASHGQHFGGDGPRGETASRTDAITNMGWDTMSMTAVCGSSQDRCRR